MDAQNTLLTNQLRGRNEKYFTIHVNQAMAEAYWNIGKRIVEEDMQGKECADCGKQLSVALTEEFGEGLFNWYTILYASVLFSLS